MLAAERHHRILDVVRQRHTARVVDLATELGVSEMTIRRDLDALASDNLINKVHGGAALRLGMSSEEPGFETKLDRNSAEKEAIAAHAKAHVRPGSALGLGAGTTTWVLAHLLREVPDLTIVTNSPAIADVLSTSRNPVDHSVVLTGGVRTPSNALVGPLAVRALTDFNLDIVFLGAHGMSVNAGFTTPNMLEADTNRAFMRAANSTVILADHTKWDTPGLSRIASFDEVDRVIVDDRISSAAHQAMSNAVVSRGAIEVAVVNGEK